MMETAPAAPFVMSQTEFLLQFLVVALDDPAVFRQMDEVGQIDISRHGRQPVLGWFGRACGPFDQQPFLGVRFGAPVIAMRGTHSQRGKARLQLLFYSLSPNHFLPSIGRQ